MVYSFVSLIPLLLSVKIYVASSTWICHIVSDIYEGGAGVIIYN